MESAISHKRLEQDHRIRLMGLGGRAVLLAESGRIDSPRPYLDLALRQYDGLEGMANDISKALDHWERESFPLWSEWESEGAEDLEARQIEWQRYPLTFFCVSLLELADDPMPPFNLHQRAQQVLDWFEQNAERLKHYVVPSPEISLDKRRELAVAALRDAVERDEVGKDLDIARWRLSVEKVAEFTADVYASAVGAGTIERLFDRAGAFLYLLSDAPDGPSTREVRSLVPKEFLADVPEHARAHYEPLRGSPFGQGLARDVVKSFREALGGAPTLTSGLHSSVELLGEIDEALGRLGSQGERIVLLIGDWSNIIGELSVDSPEGYEPIWWEVGWPAVVARYLGHTILFVGNGDARELYIVDPGGWGCFLRAQLEGGRDLLVDVSPISLERAKEMLVATPGHFPDEPDEVSKLRKLQAHVAIRAAARAGFRVTDPTRARRVVSPDT